MPKNRNREGRRQNALDRLGTDHPCCRECGNSDWRCLELHHLAGQKFGDDLVILCRNCHRILGDDQKDHPDSNMRSPDFLERLGHFLVGLGDFFALLANKLREFGQQLLAQTSASGEANGSAT